MNTNINIPQWITPGLILEIKRVFEPRYKRYLSTEDCIEIAENLSIVVEEIIKVRWKMNYEK